MFKALQSTKCTEISENSCSLVLTKSNAVVKIVLEGSLLLFLEISKIRLTTLKQINKFGEGGERGR